MTDAPSGDAPVFVFGALRSGTTVFRLMLNAHPALNNPGEVDFLFDHLLLDPDQPGGWRYDLAALCESRGFLASGLSIPAGLDGIALLQDFIGQYRRRGDGVLTLNIHRNIGRVHEILPAVRIIHMLRDPRDVARSSIGMGWAGTLYHGVDQWMNTEREWEATADRLQPDQVLHLRYEDLIDNAPRELHRVCEFLGVAFEDSMLHYHEKTTYSPPDPALIEQWKRKSTPREVALVEGKVSTLLQSRGYSPSGDPVYPGSVERLGLRMVNRLRIWRKAIRRYGLPLFVTDKLARRLGLAALHGRCQRRIRDRDAAALK
ncbi:Sulfotransferase family protein [Roseovarius pacificus]|uniref:Sulfotransferase family protein n=1 Tax=Roseovarius pacificus TaxID=337701 RepID=A0A1M7HQE3_9RHOB|nr:sulfotransferase [Roseovarius pacificus]GGO60551.1 hypothetical protein GCM10011315_35240 [Roseovarius pacificus]SHM30639.1 Sulfotransferase family protein [Roseovarius pacificus]